MQNRARRVVAAMGIVLGVSVAAGPSGADARRPLQDIHAELMALYTPIEQDAGDEKVIDHFGDIAFTGDCDDYYMAAYNQLQVWGYVPHARFLRRKDNREMHVIAFAETDSGATVCLDPNAERVRRPRDLRREYATVEIRRVLKR